MAFAVRYQVKLLHKNQIANSSTMESFVPNVRVVTLVYQFYVAVKRIRWGLLFYL